jgi:uncharacterized lipoprotein YehR (DUF1307 family)
MTYKETLFFIGKSLTINHEEQNKVIVENSLKSNNVHWESVVKVSTGHFVFPALYCNLKKANFLHYLPEELVNYMQHITDLNRNRNQQIISQAKEINELLLANNITPIFLKGTGNLLEGLYDDIAERMVGDIDFVVNIEDYDKSYQILLDDKYIKVNKEEYDHPLFRHKPRLKHPNNIAAVELHKDFILEEYVSEFNFTLIKNDIQINDNMCFLSYANQLNLSIIAKQVNDNGYLYKDISLRNAYDVFLLAQKTNAQKALDNFKSIYNQMNCFLACCFEVLGKPQSLDYSDSKETKEYLTIFFNQLDNDILRKKKNAQLSRKLHSKARTDFIKKVFTDILKKAFTDKNYRNWIFKRIIDKDWLKKKLTQFGLKKPKPNP